jgi:hypothetical protein
LSDVLVSTKRISRKRIPIRAISLAAALVVLAVIAFTIILRQRPITLRGAVVRQSDDPNREVPIAGVQIQALDDSTEGATRSGPSGAFSIRVRRSLIRRHALTLSFRHTDYKPLDIPAPSGNELYIAKMVPLRKETVADLTGPRIDVGNVSVRYTMRTEETVEIGTGVKTFEIPNKGNVPCGGHPPCSPDGKWKAATGSTFLDAGEENSFRNARVSCIAGPCPFTAIEHDGFSKGGRRISVIVRNWSDTTTFLLQAEAVRHILTDAVRNSYPVVFDRTMNFSVPAAAEGTCIEAEIGGAPIVFPIDPNLSLSWADCEKQAGSGNSRLYRCGLKPGYIFH